MALRQPSRHAAARIVSIAAHPFVTTLALAGTIAADGGGAAALRTTAAVAVLFVLPLGILTLRQVRRGAWTTVDASHPRDRPLLYSVGAAAIVACLVFFARTQPGTMLVRGTAGVLAMVAVCAAVTPWIKVSLHMAAATLAATALLWRSHPLGWVLLGVVPILAWSRVALGRHRWDEVALGTAIGACTGAAVSLLG